MTPERWQQIDQLFHSALERHSSERAVFLSQACAGDDSLRSEVESLIESHEQSDSFIEASAAGITPLNVYRGPCAASAPRPH